MDEWGSSTDRVREEGLVLLAEGHDAPDEEGVCRRESGEEAGGEDEGRGSSHRDGVEVGRETLTPLRGCHSSAVMYGTSESMSLCVHRMMKGLWSQRTGESHEEEQQTRDGPSGDTAAGGQ